MRRHAGAAELARYHEGVLGGRKAARVGAHLSGCAQCAGVSSDVAVVSSLLASVPALPMPDLLAERVQLAIAGEAAARAAGTQADLGRSEQGAARDLTPPLIPGRPELPQRSPHARRVRVPAFSSSLVLRGLAGAAAVAIVAGGGYLLATSGGTSAPSTASFPAAVPSAHGAPAAHSAIGTEASGAVRVVPVHYGSSGNYRTTVALASDVNYLPATFASQVRRQVGSSAAAYASAAVPTANEKVATSARVGGISVAALAGCLTRIAPGQLVLLADIARYNGSPAIIIVAKPANPAGIFNVTVAGLTCSASGADVITEVKVPVS